MDSQDKNESRVRRQESLARRLGEALDQLKPHGATDCPDTEVIAAYAEQALGPDQSAQWEGHFASCSRCRNILRVLAASADAPLAEKEVARLGQLISAVRSPVEISAGSARGTRPNLIDWRKRWLAPALAVAAVLAVWFAMRPPWRATNRGASETLVAQAPRDEMPASPASAAVDQLSKAASELDQKKEAANSRERSSTNPSPLNAPIEAQAKGSADSAAALDKVTPNAEEAAGSLEKKKELSAASNERETQSQAATLPQAPSPLPKATSSASPSAPFPQARAQAGTAASTASEAPRSTSQTVTVTEAAPLVEATNGTLAGTIQQEPPKDLPLNGRNYQSLLVIGPNQKYSAILKTPTGSILWRAGKDGIIERSTDAGRAWAPQKSPSQENWLAGAAVSDTVCWLVGSNGAIARTVNGEQWERVAPPTNAAGTGGKLPDWTGVVARDALNATITAGDGRRFATQDGGKTWQVQ